MAWQGILGHDDVVERFRRAIARNRLASSFLFVGPEGIGKRTFALKLAQALLCRASPEAALDPCGRCPSCVQAVAGTHPDLEVISKPADRAMLPLYLLIGDKDHPAREALCHKIAMKPFLGGRKVAIVEDADYFHEEGANCLLKTLEEPPPQSVVILIGTSPAKQLPTIRSRCQLVRFRPLAPEVVAQVLTARGLIDDPAQALRLAARGGGSVRAAIALADSDLGEFRTRLQGLLAAPRIETVRLAGALQQFVDQSGKEAPARRLRLRQILDVAAEFYEQLLCGKLGLLRRGEEGIQGQTGQAVLGWPGDPEAAAACLDRCLQAAEQIDRNAHPTTVLECWLDDLARIANRRSRPPDSTRKPQSVPTAGRGSATM
jgi:DNA polymerase-3 subunit delta'